MRLTACLVVEALHGVSHGIYGIQEEAVQPVHVVLFFRKQQHQIATVQFEFVFDTVSHR